MYIITAFHVKGVKLVYSIYYIHASVLLQNRPLVKFKGNCIQGPSGLYAIPLPEAVDVICHFYTVEGG